MAVKLNRTAFDFAKELIVAGRFVFDDRDGWSEHRPSAQTENEFLAAHGFRMRNGIWGSTRRSTRIPRDGMNSLMVILKTSIVAEC